MKNENLFPFERNNYFFGKLMTEREYDKEQLYFNNKRRLINLAAMSSGVLCGFVVTKVDGETIAVESGLAIDGLGREIAAPQIIVTRLSDLGGFTDDRGLTPHVYLCAEYAETPVEPVHSFGAGNDEARFGCTRETVRLYLRYGEPEPFEIVRPNTAEHRNESLEKVFDRGKLEQLYLAKIYLVRWEDAYDIDRIEQLPFGQYACVLALPETPPVQKAEDKPKTREKSHRYNDAPPPVHTLGAAEIKIPDGAKIGSIHYSDNIPHNLGLVPAAVTLGLSVDGGTVFGDAEIFGESADFDYAVRVRDYDGTFQIGVRIKKRWKERTLRFLWTAVAAPSRTGPAGDTTPRILLKPSILRLKPLETRKLTAEIHALPEDELTWSVREPEGGSITREGHYTAPVDPGVYTAMAKIGDVCGTALIIVQSTAV